MAAELYTEVSSEQFFEKVGPMNVHPEIVGNYPYASVFRTQDRTEVGRITSDGKYLLIA